MIYHNLIYRNMTHRNHRLALENHPILKSYAACSKEVGNEVFGLTLMELGWSPVLLNFPILEEVKRSVRKGLQELEDS